MAAVELAQRDLPDEATENVLLRLDAAADVIRASAACRGYRRVVCDREFVRRFRLLRLPPVVGAFSTKPLADDGGPGFRRAVPPQPSAPLALGVARAADLAFSFLPDPAGSWRIRDVRDGRVLLARRGASAFQDLVVCDPRHRRFVQIPPVPDGLADSPRCYGALELELFLAPAGEEGSPLRVICNALCANKMETMVFSSATREWRLATSLSFAAYDYRRVKKLGSFVRQYANGCFYWTHCNRRIIIVLDASQMLFSIASSPVAMLCRSRRSQSLAIVDVGEGRTGLLILVGCSLHLCRLETYGYRYSEWRYERRIPLLDGFHWYVMAASEGFVLLLAVCSQSQQVTEWQYFTMEVKTWRLERLCTTEPGVKLHHLYADYPPPLSPPSISDGLPSSFIDQDQSGAMSISQ